MQTTLDFNPAERLAEKPQLDGGWTVVRKIPRLPGSTGGNFSVGYVVENKRGRRAFLKALDFSDAFKQPNSTELINSLTSSYVYEKSLLNQCRSGKLSRVNVSIDDGEVPTGDLHETLPVPYIIFELADGDVRRRLNQSNRFDLAFVLRALHHSATGIRQLHDLKVAHQDLKPSNVLDFRDVGCRVADLGRSSSQDGRSPHDGMEIAGDKTYAPPELLYGHISPDWRVRRFACDLYQIGSLAVFFFVKVGITALWYKSLDQTFLPNHWGEGYPKVLPHVRQAHDLAFEEFEEQIPGEIRGILGPAVRQLCEPDPQRRGHPRTLSQRVNRYSVQRYISIFDRIARIAEMRLRKTVI